MIIIFTSIASYGGDKKTQKDPEKLNVVTTTTILEDAVRNIGGDNVEVESLMGPGIDPHLYKASAGDVEKMMNADLIIFNGIHLEGKMSDIFEKLGQIDVKTIAPGDIIDSSKLIQSFEFEGNYDPHIWFDVKLWTEVVDVIADSLIELDSENKDFYISNGEEYKKELEELDEYIKNRAKEIPDEQRVLITAHDAFNYFGNAYGFQVEGLQGISTVAEAGTLDVKELADFIAERKIPAIFVESSVPTKNIEALQAAVHNRGFNVEIGGELYSDSLGNPDTEEGTYIGTVKYNVDTIVDALIEGVK
ncbi:MAG: zinc ABC transporter substrate-binding protein [Clostridiaceae bacterium]|nr:zinc ABC transporter substrate-binding protein [Clostridiaceae bacterium]MBW4861178.1 zinc ABC transporter substrate-binding protein [Clostridiaceae bacterium]MBW4869922.1 zinc ABC transporter substrate-binding protein [Clostridiaceae bacterium]